MIYFKTDDLFNAKAEALVNTVNTVGVMGKGIALQFKKRYPHNYEVYKQACKAKEFNTGQILTVKDGDLLDQKYIINFPTKAHWKSPSKLEYIGSGLLALRAEIIRLGVGSIAIPPLGCGNGGLEWSVVKPMIVDQLQDLNIDIQIYEPAIKIKSILQKERKHKEVKLTPARAMLLYLMFHYEAVGEQSSLFAANKLAYFLQRKGENLRLKFTAHHYGPYAVQLNHVLYALNGVYLKGMEQNTASPFEPLHLTYNKFDEIEAFIHSKLTADQKSRLDDVLQLIKMFESSFSLELLATVDYIMSTEGVSDIDGILTAIGAWNRRKENIFQADQVELAIRHLSQCSSQSIEYSS